MRVELGTSLRAVTAPVIGGISVPSWREAGSGNAPARPSTGSTSRRQDGREAFQRRVSMPRGRLAVPWCKSRAKPRSCAVCDADISGREPRAQYCSRACKDRARTLRRQRRRLSNAAANPKQCVRCGQPIPLERATHHRVKYCSEVCNRHAARDKARSGHGRCTIGGCDGIAAQAGGAYAGLCAAHARRRRCGKSLEAPIVRKKPVLGLCAYADCERGVRARGLCASHYEMQRNGEPLRPIGLPNPRTVPVGSRHLSSEGYVRVKTAAGWRDEHRLVMENHLGRPLASHENVHHINGNRADNRLSNLELWSSSHPSGQRVEDKIAWAKEFLATYEGFSACK